MPRSKTNTSRRAAPPLLEDFAKGHVTLAELEGISKDTQDALASHAVAAMERGDAPRAGAILRGLLAVDPYDADYLTAYAQCLAMLGHEEDAVQLLSLALILNPMQGAAAAARADLHLRAGRFADAAKDLERTVEADPEGTHAATRRAQAILAAMGETLRTHAKAILTRAAAAHGPARKPKSSAGSRRRA